MTTQNRLEAAEEVCWNIILGMQLGLDGDTILKDLALEDMKNWANLAARDGLLPNDEDNPVNIDLAVT